MRKTKEAERAPGRTIRADPMLDRLRRAWEQIDATPDGALGWLIRFTREDASRWLPGQAEAHGHRLLALVYGRQPANRLRRDDEDIPPVTATDVVQVHAELGAFFHTLVAPGPKPMLPLKVKVPMDDLQVWIVRGTLSGEKPAKFYETYSGSRRSILFHVVKALALASDRLLACKECGKPFVAARKKEFCGSKCLQHWHDTRRDKAGRKAGRRLTTRRPA
jgi:hypothetical protein